jgi:hypothetical protein
MGQSRVDTKQKHNKENSKDEQHGSHQKTRGEQQIHSIQHLCMNNKRTQFHVFLHYRLCLDCLIDDFVNITAILTTNLYSSR